MREKHKVDPELIIREGEIVSEILAQIKDDSEVDILVLGAGTDRKGPGPLVTQLSKSSGKLEVPIVIVPGSLSKAQLEAIV
jgi:nucleotide-binding universal stress UspA family protein